MGRDTRSRGHYHSHEHAMICQVHGEKRVILYPPSASSRLYPYPGRRGSTQHERSQVDFIAPDFEEFPRLTGTRSFDTTLEPGDALFIPIHWWHAAYGVGAMMSASLLWQARWQEYRLPRPGLRALVDRVRLAGHRALR